MARRPTQTSIKAMAIGVLSLVIGGILSAVGLIGNTFTTF